MTGCDPSRLYEGFHAAPGRPVGGMDVWKHGDDDYWPGLHDTWAGSTAERPSTDHTLRAIEDDLWTTSFASHRR